MEKKQIVSEFGTRLAYYRKAKGLTQQKLGEMVGVSYRVIAYYEGETKYPPARLIVPLANALGISTDEMLGATEIKRNFDTRNTALRRNLKIVESLPLSDQRAVVHYIDMIAKTRKLDQKTAQSK